MAVFYQLTAILFEGDTSRAYPALWLTAWAAAGVASLACWIAAAGPLLVVDRRGRVARSVVGA